MSDPRIPRISEQAREARRPLPVATLLSARQETIHRDPGAARAARSVQVSDKLPDYVEEALRNCDIYGDDAYGVQTPRASLRLSIAKAIRDAEERMRERCAKVCDGWREIAGTIENSALTTGAMAVVAKAIRSIPLENAPTAIHPQEHSCEIPHRAVRGTLGVAGDRCETGNECGRTGCPECQQ